MAGALRPYEIGAHDGRIEPERACRLFDAEPAHATQKVCLAANGRKAIQRLCQLGQLTTAVGVGTHRLGPGRTGDPEPFAIAAASELSGSGSQTQRSASHASYPFVGKTKVTITILNILLAGDAPAPMRVARAGSRGRPGRSNLIERPSGSARACDSTLLDDAGERHIVRS